MENPADVMIESPFPNDIGFAVKTMETVGDFVLSPEEMEILSPKAVQKRRDEFLLGRAAACSALKQLGFASPPPVLKGRNREPIWPDGYIGTITHSNGVAVAAACARSYADGIGIDIETLEKNVSTGVFKLTCTEKELELIHSDSSKNQTMFKRIFSAKEAGFKAFFRHAQAYIDYREAELSWDSGTSSFEGVLLTDAGKKYPEGSRFTVGSRLIDGFVFSHVLLPLKHA